jgi:arginyl-tRNA--protein-N-Asp/Glu arginylyltransferase
MRSIPQINLYATDTHPCSYLEGQEARTVFVDPYLPVTAELYGQLSARGFRRSGNHIYRPQCQACQACVPIRITAGKFQPDRQQKRIWKRNQDLSVEVSTDINSGEYYRLYERYITARHRDGDMYPPSPEQFEAFLATPFFDKPANDLAACDETAQLTLYIEFREGLELKAIAVTDILPVGLSAVYTFFDPAESNRSLGVFSVLFQIELAKKLTLPHLYLGYWIKNSQKMNYKTNYKPYELLQGGKWAGVES